MLRGITRFTCDNCGKTFLGPDVEWNCTVFTAPVRCPQCGSWHTYVGLKLAYRAIWAHLDETTGNG